MESWYSSLLTIATLARSLLIISFDRILPIWTNNYCIFWSIHWSAIHLEVFEIIQLLQFTFISLILCLQFLLCGVIDVEVSVCIVILICSDGIVSFEASKPIRTVVIALRYSFVKVTMCSDKSIGEGEYWEWRWLMLASDLKIFE